MQFLLPDLEGEVIYIEFVETPEKTARHLTTSQIPHRSAHNNPKNTENRAPQIATPQLV
jgi:hypothetical protein